VRCHDFHLTAYEARQLGAEIVLHLADDWRPNPTEESHIRFSDVELHHFTHTGGTIIFGIEEVPLSQILDEHWERITRWAPQYGGVPHWDRDIATATSGSLRQPDTKLGTLVHPSDSPASLSPNLSKMLQTNSPKPPDPYEGCRR
jgi:hypothetical protein